VDGERLYTLTELAQVLPIKRSRQTLYRWAVYGANGAGKKKVWLESKVISGVLHSSVEAYHRFVERSNSGVGDDFFRIT
jgi:ABC-type molybdenum transport system ATPase subunit/photorepair protein PhrA